MITDRLRFTILEANTDEILSRDLTVKDPQVSVKLSAPCTMSLKVDRGEYFSSSRGIRWKNYGQVVVATLEIDRQRLVWAWGYVTDHRIDAVSGELTLQVTGPLGYLKGIQWLENYNPITVDPFEVVQRIFGHVQGYPNAQLAIEVVPAFSGTQMLPGFGYDGNILSFDFWALFIRAIDFNDCGDYLTSLARDICFDMHEEAWWNEDGTLHRQIRLVYVATADGDGQNIIRQDYLTFRVGDNVLSAEIREEMDIEPVSDVIVRGWLPGRVYSARVSNSDMTRYRRTVLEEDANIDSTERAAVWAKRKLQRRNIPPSFKKIIIDPNHPSAPLGSFGVGDLIFIQSFDFPWLGEINEWHRVISISYAESSGGGGGGGQQQQGGAPAGMVELEVKHEGAFNYDQIIYDPDWEQQPVADPNRISNGYFSDSLAGWRSIQGQWIRVASQTYDNTYSTNAGSVRCDLDDFGEGFISNRAWCVEGETLTLCCAVKWQDVLCGPTDVIALIGNTYFNGAGVGSFVVEQYVNPVGAHGWQLFQITDWVVPEGVNEIALQFHVSGGVSHGISWWTYARVIPTPPELP